MLFLVSEHKLNTLTNFKLKQVGSRLAEEQVELSRSPYGASFIFVSFKGKKIPLVKYKNTPDGGFVNQPSFLPPFLPSSLPSFLPSFLSFLPSVFPFFLFFLKSVLKRKFLFEKGFLLPRQPDSPHCLLASISPLLTS